MKFSATLFILAFLATTIYAVREVPHSVALITKGLRKECIAVSKVSEDLLARGEKGDFPEEREFKCYLKCLLRKMNLMSKAGEIDYDTMISITPEDVRDWGVKMINDCRGTPGTDKCEIAWNYNQCLYNSNPDQYFFV